MRRWAIAGCAAVACLLVSVQSPAAEPIGSQPAELMTTPLAGDSEREVKIVNVVLPPGADSGRIYRHGDEFTTVQEGEVRIDVDGKGEQVVKAGEALHIDPMVVHRTRNISDKPARLMQVLIIAKAKPMTEKAE